MKRMTFASVIFSTAVAICCCFATGNCNNNTTFASNSNLVGDVNYDGKVDASDAAYILQYAASQGSNNDMIWPPVEEPLPTETSTSEEMTETTTSIETTETATETTISIETTESTNTTEATPYFNSGDKLQFIGTDTITSLTVRSGPMDIYTSIAWLTIGETVEVIGNTNHWYSIITDDNAKGYVYVSDPNAFKLLNPETTVNTTVTTTETATTETTTTTSEMFTKNLACEYYIFEGGGFKIWDKEKTAQDREIIGYLEKGEQFLIVGCSELDTNSYQIYSEDGLGYVSNFTSELYTKVENKEIEVLKYKIHSSYLIPAATYTNICSYNSYFTMFYEDVSADIENYIEISVPKVDGTFSCFLDISYPYNKKIETENLLGFWVLTFTVKDGKIVSVNESLV